MREIKFRVWHEDVMLFSPCVEELLFEDGGYWTHIRQGDVAEIMQYTGLKDKNGKEIYEGDIIKTPYAFNGGSFFDPEDWIGIWIGKVIFSAYHGAIVRKALVWDGAAMDDDLISYVNKPIVKKSTWSVKRNCEIVGNIHENKELLDIQD